MVNGTDGSRFPDDDSIDLFALVNPVLENRKLVLAATCAAFAVSLILALLSPGGYSAKVKLFIGKASDPLAQIRASAFGEGSTDQYTSDFGLDASRFYVEIIKSRAFLERLADVELEMIGGQKITPRSFFTAGADSPDAAALVTRALVSAISTSSDKSTGIMNLEVKSKDPVFAMNLANVLTRELELFSMEFLAMRSRTKRIFVESKMKESEQKMLRAEEKLKSFVGTNRNITISPDLSMKQDKFERELTLERDIFGSFVKEYEKLKLEEKRELSPLIVLEPAAKPTDKTGMSRRSKVIAGTAAGLFAGFFAAFLKSMMRRLDAENSPEYVRFRSNLSAIRKELLSLVDLRQDAGKGGGGN